MSQEKSTNIPSQGSEDDPPKRESGSAQSPNDNESSPPIHQETTRPMPPVDSIEDEEPIFDIDEGPRPGPVDEIQEALFEAAQSGLSTEVEFDELADPIPDIDEAPRPGPVDEVQEALFNAAQKGLAN